MVKKVILTTLLVFVLLISNTLYKSGAFKSIISHSDLNDISIYTDLAGTEDLEIDEQRGLLFISSSDRWNIGKPGSKKDGIYILDLNDSEAKPVKLSMTYTGGFHPHGISYLKKNDKDYLFAVNHNNNGDFIEVFQFENNQLTHLKSYKSESLCCPNDLVATDLDKFYVTNDHGAAKGFSRTLEEYLMLANSYVLYFDGNKYRKVLQGIRYANGVNLSKDGKTLYVTEASGGKIFVMNRNPNTGDLTLRFSKELKTGADNISIDKDGSLWIGSHPQLLKFVDHATNTGKYSPSQVLKLTHKGEDDFDVVEVYLNDGEQLSGSSVALHYKDQVFVGVVFENKLLRGTLK